MDTTQLNRQKPTIEDLRTHLFATLRDLRDKDNPLDIERAKAIADIGRVVVDTAKIEVEFLKTTGALKSTNFLPDGDEQHTRPQLAAAGGGRRA
jgi:hypothetical protein